MSVGYKIGPVQQKTLIAGLRTSQIVLMVTAVFGGILLVSVIRGQVGILLAVFLIATCVGLSFAFVGGRPVDAWIPALFKYFTGVLSGQRRSISSAPHEGFIMGSERGVSSPPPPLKGVRILKVNLSNNRQIGIVKDSKMGTYSAIVQLAGQSFGLLDHSEQAQKLEAWGGVLSGCARQGSPVHRLQWIERTVPEVGDAMAAYLQDSAEVDEDHPLRESYEELIASAGPITQEHLLMLVITISARKSARDMRRRGKGDTGACEVLIREVKNIESHLRNADIEVIGLMTPREVSMAFRTAFDPGVINGLVGRGLESPELRGSAPRNAWPMATEDNWDYYKTDNIVHRCYWISEWPRVEAPPDFFAPVLLQTTATRTVSVVMEPIPPATAFRKTESAHTNFVADEDIRAKAGYLHTARRQREYESVLQREEELSDGHALFRFSGFVVVSANNLDRLEEAASDVEQAAYQSRLELRPCYGEQAIAFSVCLPLGRGVK